MFAVYAESTSTDDPLSGLVVGERPEPEAPDDWVTVQVRAAAINHHDYWSLQGVGLPDDRLPMILGCDAAGTTEDGTEVVVHSVISDPAWTGDETLDPKRSLLSERWQGTFAERVRVPARNVVPKPDDAVVRAGRLSADGVADGVPDAVHPVRPAAGRQRAGAGRRRRRGDSGHRAGAGGRDAGVRHQPGRGKKRARAEELGAHEAVETGARLPQRVDAVMETVGRPPGRTRSSRCGPAGRWSSLGRTSGFTPESGELNRIFFLQLRVHGSTMGTREELRALADFLACPAPRR